MANSDVKTKRLTGTGAASIGRKKYGAKRFQELAARGRKNAKG